MCNRFLSLSRRWLWAAVLLPVAGSQISCSQPSKPAQLPVIGATAAIEIGVERLPVLARVDTGAQTCAVHVTNVRVDSKDKDMKKHKGKKISFTIRNRHNEEKDVSTVVENVTWVRSGVGRERRYKVYLDNREEMKYKLLLGRNWLRGTAVVDVTKDVKQ